MRSLVLLALAFLAIAAPASLAAQRGAEQRVPRRPQLAASADTNDARAYYRHGADQLARRPQEAADAFYWAARLDPSWANPLYGRRVALLMTNPSRLKNYMEGNRRVVESREIRGIDSLYYRALHQDPFFYHEFDRQLIEAYVQAWSAQVQVSNPSLERGLLEFQMNSYFRRADPGMRAWLAYSERRFLPALELYATALRSEREKAGYYMSRGRIFYLVGNYSSAVEEMTQAIEELRKRDDRRLVRFYDSKALIEHSLGLIHEKVGNAEGAREAYGRALQEDISYHPAHVRLGLLSLLQGDTASALGALDLAVQLREDDPAVRYAYGTVLLAAARHDEAVEQLRQAITLEPYFAAPYLSLGEALEVLGRSTEAREAYDGYMARASRHDPGRGTARQRLALLGAG